jgi:two-component system phosphate regulon sensor histidine kinase PhoR
MNLQSKLLTVLFGVAFAAIAVFAGLDRWLESRLAAFSASLLFAAVFAVLASRLLARHWTGPLFRVTEGIRKLGFGQFQGRVLADSRDEIALLADRFNEAAAALENRIMNLTEERARLAAILSGMVEGVMILDGRGTVLMINAALEEMFHLKSEDLVGRSSLEVLRHFPVIEFIRTVLDQKKSQSRELAIRVPEEKWFHVQASVPPDHREAKVFVVFVFHNITEIKRLERVRKDFVANVSHELRTPLTSIKGYVEALLDGAKDDPERNAEFLDVLKKHTDRLNNIVSDLLTLAQIESGQTGLQYQTIGLSDLIERAVSMLKPMADRKRQRLSMFIGADLPVIKGDPEKLTQVLTNLIDNAIKYTPEKGSVSVEAGPVGDGLEVTVSDNGLGIPPKDVSRIFERFFRVDRARSRDLGGTGLGLSIVKHIVESHGGSVRVESEPGKGSRFIVFLPAGIN